MYYKRGEFKQLQVTFPKYVARPNTKHKSDQENSRTINVPEMKSRQGISRLKRNKKKQMLMDKNVPSMFNIPGLEKVIHSPNHWYKFIWIISTLAFYGLCMSQLADRVTLYFKAPIVLDMTIETVTSIDFPAVAICPPFGPHILHYIRYKWRKIYILGFFSNENNYTLERIWNEFGITQDKITIDSSCSQVEGNESTVHERKRKSCGENLKMDVEHFPTFWGNCLKMTPVTKMSYRGAWTFISFKLKQDAEGLDDMQHPLPVTYQELEMETVFIPLSRTILPTHELAKSYYRISNGSEVFVSFQVERYLFLNTKRNPCVFEKISNECKHSCLEKSLKEKVRCSLPYMGNSSLEPCKRIFDVRRAIEDVGKVYREFDNCNCPRACNETVVSFSSDYHAIKDDRAVFSLKYPANTIQIATERFSYTFSSLLSDIGGNLGFCVGLCLFSFVEIFVSTFQMVTVWIRDKCARRTSKLFV